MVLVGFTFAASAETTAQGQESKDRATTNALQTTLRDYLSSPLFGDDDSITYSAGFFDLNRDGKVEVLVYLTGRSLCGSGGCVVLVIDCTGTSYKVMQKITVVHPPIRVLSSRSHGWNDLRVTVRGGGIQVDRQVVLKFDGARYPSNPTVIRPLGVPVSDSNTVFTLDKVGTRLYPPDWKANTHGDSSTHK